MDLLPYFLFLLIVANISYGANNILESENVIKVLNDVCHSYLKKELAIAINASLELHGKFILANTTCQQSLHPLKDKCSNCVKDQCWQRASQIGCQGNDYFNVTFATGIFSLNEKINNFYANIIPYFFNEDLEGFFGQNVPYFFYNNFFDTILKNIPKPQGTKLARLIERSDQSDTSGNVDYVKAGFIQDGLTSVIKYMQEFIRDFIKKYASEHAKEKAGNFFTESLPNAIQKAGGAIKRFFQGIFSRRRRSLPLLPSTCEEFLGDNQVQLSCSQYLQYCSECLPDKSQLTITCPDLSKVEDEVQKIIWIIPAMLSDGPVFQIQNISHFLKDETSVNIKVKLVIYGRTTEIGILAIDNDEDSEEMANVVCNPALDWFKKHWEKKEDVPVTEISYNWAEIERINDLKRKDQTLK